jgi:hypothetical protein
MFCCFLFLITQFDTLGKIRAYSGEDRFNQWAAIYENTAPVVETLYDDEEKSALARASTLNQLSQVVRLQDERGFYGGKTLSYLFFAFIPRFIWPDKPLIMQGRWFALEAGLAYNHGEESSLAKVNNSVNMTVAGEFFLNFGFLGVILGMGLIGYFMQQFWFVCNFFQKGNNLSGTLFGVFLMLVAYFYLQVDAQFIVTLFQVFAVALLLDYILKKINTI